mmetsp:Transcript_10875/g.28017  ORF Transcript_10875/g.28017 Transcript_10875/m.28017 type:complete len:132 (+) Transcript_10875:143-538(+)
MHKQHNFSLVARSPSHLSADRPRLLHDKPRLRRDRMGLKERERDLRLSPPSNPRTLALIERGRGRSSELAVSIAGAFTPPPSTSLLTPASHITPAPTSSSSDAGPAGLDDWMFRMRLSIVERGTSCMTELL